jgi:transcriptional regulator with XRE-family HTH domain
MYQLSTDSRLGISLREQRKRARWTQAELARHAGLTAKTVGLLEPGSGNLGSWDAALEALGLELGLPLFRLRELSTQSSNGTFSNTQRQSLDKESQALSPARRA